MADPSLLNYVASMQQQGYTDDQIAGALKEQGYPPADIQDSLNKSKIKSAVAQPGAGPQGVQAAQQAQAAATTGAAGAVAGAAGPAYTDYVQGMSTETVTEIAEQIINEKLGALTGPISDVSIFKERVDKQVSFIDERLKKIEGAVEEIRSAVIKKIGEYGEGIDEIKNEMGMIQDSFKKVVKPLSERAASAKVSIKKTAGVPEEGSEKIEEPEEEIEEPAEEVKPKRKTKKTKEEKQTLGDKLRLRK